MEVNALFVSGNTIKSAARALPTFSASYALLRTTPGQHIVVTARYSRQVLIQYLYPMQPKAKASKTRNPNSPPSGWGFFTRFGAVCGSNAKKRRRVNAPAPT
jgi:hypothetical protein